MQWLIVLRVSHFALPPRPLKSITAFQLTKDARWSYSAQDIDYRHNTVGVVHVFRREDAARKLFEQVKGIDSDGSSAYLIFASKVFKRSAAKKALGCLFFNNNSAAEIIEEYHHKIS